MDSDTAGVTALGVARASARLEAAIFDPHSMPDALEAAGHALGFDHFCLVHANLNELNVVAADYLLDAFGNYERGGWKASDYRPAVIKQSSAGTLWLEQDIVPDDVRRSSDIYRGLYLPSRSAVLAGWQFELGEETWMYALTRSEASGDVRPEEAVRLSEFMPFANRAMELAHRMRHVRVQGMMDFASSTGVPLVLIDHAGEVAAVNAAAERLFGQDFDIRERRLRAANPDAQMHLDALAQAARDTNGLASLPNFVIPTRAGASPILARPLRVRGLGLDTLPGARIILTLVDPGRRPEIAEDDLRALFGLSAAEANVAALLASGKDAQEVADIRGVAVGTIRTQIRHLFEKVDVNRLGELIAITTSVVKSPDTSMHD